MRCAELRLNAVWVLPWDRPHCHTRVLATGVPPGLESRQEKMHWGVVWHLLNTLPTLLPWECLWGLWSGHIKLRPTLTTSFYLNYLFKVEKETATHQYSCLRNPMDRVTGGLQSMGSHRIRHHHHLFKDPDTTTS